MIRIAGGAARAVCLSLFAAAVVACGGPEGAEGDEAPGEVEALEVDQAGATAYLLNGKYYYRTDSFSEACSGPTLAIASAPGVTNQKNYIQRGKVTYVPYYWWSTNGWWRWWCGGSAERAECSGATNPNAIEYLRVYWENGSSTINIQCFTQCGDGSSAADCAPL